MLEFIESTKCNDVLSRGTVRIHNSSIIRDIPPRLNLGD